jgi:hypothetical protein
LENFPFFISLFQWLRPASHSGWISAKSLIGLREMIRIWLKAPGESPKERDRKPNPQTVTFGESLD